MHLVNTCSSVSALLQVFAEHFSHFPFGIKVLRNFLLPLVLCAVSPRVRMKAPPQPNKIWWKVVPGRFLRVGGFSSLVDTKLKKYLKMREGRTSISASPCSQACSAKKSEEERLWSF